MEKIPMKEFPWELTWSYKYRSHFREDAGPIKIEDLNVNYLITGTGVFVVWLVGSLADVTEVLLVGCDSEGSLPMAINDAQYDERIKNRAAAWAPCEVYITWAFVYSQDCRGVQNFLIANLKPTFGPQATSEEPLQVNVPGFLSSSLDRE